MNLYFWGVGSSSKQHYAPGTLAINDGHERNWGHNTRTSAKGRIYSEMSLSLSGAEQNEGGSKRRAEKIRAYCSARVAPEILQNLVNYIWRIYMRAFWCKLGLNGNKYKPCVMRFLRGWRVFEKRGLIQNLALTIWAALYSRRLTVMPGV